MRNLKRGFLLVTALLICVVMLLIGMGLVGSEASRYSSASLAAESVQARELALAGLEDARIKMELDPNFPPAPENGPSQAVYAAGPNDTQPLFSYSEGMTIPGLKAVPGSYEITIDSSNATPEYWDEELITAFDPAGPRQVVIITSVGTVGTSLKVLAQYRMRAELDVSLYTRQAPYTNANPHYFRFTHVEDDNVP